MSPATHRLLRVAMLLVLAAGVGLAIHRLRRTDDQLELTHYVERDLPPLLGEEHVIADRLSRLMEGKAITAPDARKQLVDEINPRLVALRHRAEALSPTTLTVRELASEYLRVVDAWAEAARAAVRAIDDPKLPQEAGLVSVKTRLDEAAHASQTFSAHVVSTCRMHRLAPPR